MLSKQRLPINHTKLIKIKTFLIGYKIKNINMKKSYIIFSLVLFISSCVTTNQVFFSDPNYLNSDEFSSAETINEAYKETYSENTLENQDTILENDQYDAYDNDYYYDFSYSSRIRRFHRPMMLNYGFYSGYYTDYYWYNPDPFYWGSSIYYGYGWDSPYYYSPYYSYYSPYYSFYSPFYFNHHSYWHNHGHYGHHGYHNHYHDYYSNNYGLNSNNYTYGPRGSLTSNNRNLIKSNVKSRNTWNSGSNKKFTTNKYTTKNPQYNTNKNSKTITKNSLNNFIKEKNNRKKTYSNKKTTYRPKNNFKSNNRSSFKSRSSSSKSSGSRNISRSPKRK